MILFSLVPAFGLFALLALLECGLRVFGDPATFRFLNTVTIDGVSYVQVNRNYLEKYFPANSAVIPDFKPSAIPAEKPASGLRVLCLGESSMFGTPYYQGATIPDLVRRQLRHSFPDREVEVINLGASAINTNVIRDIAPATLGLQPDVVLIYTGHNDFYGPDGVGASWLERQWPSLTRAKYAFRDMRLVRLVQHWLRSSWLSRNPSAEQNLMKQVSAGSDVALHSAETQRISRLFEENLEQIILTYRSHGIPVIVSTIESNLFFPPFAPAEEGVLPGIRAQVEHGKIQEASARLRGAHPSDSTNACIEYWLGRTKLAEGDSNAALILLRRARDLDLLKFRAPTSFDTIIIQTCARLNVPCIHADSILAAHSPGHIPGPSLFWEHLHLRAEGYYLIAEEFVQAMFNHGLLPTTQTSSTSHEWKLPFQADTLGISWLDRAVADIAIIAITQRWPFDQYHISLDVYDSSDPALQHIAMDFRTKKTTWSEALLRSADWFASHGDLRSARSAYETLLEESPRMFQIRYREAMLLRELGDIDGAIREYRKSIAVNPEYPFSRVDLGLLLVNKGAFEEAAKEFHAALEMPGAEKSPASLRATACYGLAAISANHGNYAEALRLADESLKLLPTYQSAAILRAQIVAQMNHRK